MKRLTPATLFTLMLVGVAGLVAAYAGKKLLARQEVVEAPQLDLMPVPVAESRLEMSLLAGPEPPTPPPPPEMNAHAAMMWFPNRVLDLLWNPRKSTRHTLRCDQCCRPIKFPALDKAGWPRRQAG